MDFKAGTEQKLINYAGDDKIISSHEMRDIIAANPRREIIIRAGLPSLDSALGGFEGGELTVISGLTGNGKTLLAQSFTRQFSAQDVNSVWFSYEVMPRQFLKSYGNNLPLFYMPSQLELNSLEWLEQRVYESKLKFDCRAVFIDHLHFLVDMRTKNNMSLEIGHTMRTLKKMAIRHNMCFFLIAHTAKIKPENEPDLDSLRDSSFIGQEADNVLIIWRKVNEKTREMTEKEAVLKVVKDRKNGTFSKIPLIKNQSGWLVEVSDYEDSQRT